MRELKIEGFILPISLKVEYALTANGKNVWTFTHDELLAFREQINEEIKTVESLGDLVTK